MGNFIIWGIFLIILGILAVPSLVLSKKPNAKEIFDKIAPIQGIIGAVFVIIGLWRLIDALINIEIVSYFPLLWITFMLNSLVMFILGFIFAYGLIKKYALAKNEDAAKKGDELMKKLTAMQATFGIAAIVLGLWTIIYYFILKSQIASAFTF